MSYIKCETNERPHEPPFKEVLLEMCNKRGDEKARKVELRMNGVLTDLPAAEARYHKKCHDTFRCLALSPRGKKIDDEALGFNG